MFVGRTFMVAAGFWLAGIIPCAAQVASADAGRVPQRFEAPPQPKSLPRATSITLPSTVAPSNAAAISLTVARFSVVGSTVFAEDDFSDLTAPLTGKRISLGDVYALAARITARYGDAGFVLSRAIIPPQSLAPTGAVVRIEIVEGYVDDVVWPSGLELYRDFFSDYRRHIVESRPANIKVIERYLLLASDLPGLTFTSTFKSSQANAKASTLLVSMSEKRIDAETSADNRGSKGRGPWQARGMVTANNWLGLHEAIAINYATVMPSMDQLQFFEGTWRQVLSSEGLSLTVTGSHNTGIPGLGALQAIDYDSTGLLFSATLAFPVIRLRDENLTVSGIAFTEDVKSDALSAPFTEDRGRNGVKERPRPFEF